MFKRRNDLAGMEWVKKAGMKSRWGAWSIGMNYTHGIVVGIECAVVIAVGVAVVVSTKDIHSIGSTILATVAFVGVIDGAGWLIHSSRCLEHAWRLEDWARVENTEETRKEIELGVNILRDYRQIDYSYAFAFFGLAGTLLAVAGLLL